MNNLIKTTVLLTLLTAFIIWLGAAIGGKAGMIFALILSGAMNFTSYWFSDRIVLSMYRAQEVSAGQAPELYQTVQTLARPAGLPMPRLYRIPQETPNAFATGRNPEHAVVAVTDGLLNLMDPDELEGVLAHEMSHIKNRDILIGSIAATLAGAIMVLADIARWSAIFGATDEEGPGIFGLILMSVFAPIAALLVQMAISRSEEYRADARGAELAGSGQGLARALEKLGSYSKRIPLKNARPNTAHMFIVNPLSSGSLLSLFSTHPPLEKRIARLRGEGGSVEAKKNGSRPLQTQHERARAFWERLK